jgi:Domain of unknown function (DUF1816)
MRIYDNGVNIMNFKATLSIVKIWIRSFILNLALHNKMATQTFDIWSNPINSYRQAWWIEIFTEQPKCTYYFGPFGGAGEAEIASKGFIEDLESEFAQGIKTTIDRHSQPTLLTIEHDLA